MALLIALALILLFGPVPAILGILVYFGVVIAYEHMRGY